MAYLAPTSLSEALDAVARGARVVAGGTDLFPATGETRPAGELLDLTRIDGLRGIGRVGDGWRIGATTTWAEIAAAGLPPAFAALQQAAREVGAIQIQNAATIGGNLCNASPAADGVPPLLVLEAQVELVSATGRRVLGLSDFILGPRRTALRPGEILSAVLLPPLPEAVSAFVKLGARRYLVISIAMVAALVQTDGQVITGARVCVGACAPVARRLSGLEQALAGQPLQALQSPVLVNAADLAPLAPIDDVRADAGYRLEAAAELVRRALRIAGGVAHG